MAKAVKRTKHKPVQERDEVRRAREESKQVRRDLAMMRGMALLSRQLEHAIITERAASSRLAVTIAHENDCLVVTTQEYEALRAENGILIAQKGELQGRVAELEAQLANTTAAAALRAEQIDSAEGEPAGVGR